MTGPLRIGARRSPLARTQADHVAGLLAEHGVASEFVGITTAGDLDYRRLTEIGGTGVFVSGVRDALRAGRADLAVHSLKDLPTAPAAGLVVAAVPPREDARDVLIGCRLADLRDGLRIGTGAPRRAVQLLDLAARREVSLTVEPVRGNVGTRLDLVRRGVVDAVVLAAAGLRRLGYLSGTPDHPDLLIDQLPAEILSPEVMLPAPGQGALALEVSLALDGDLDAAVRSLDDPRAHIESLVERGFLAALEAGCTAPVGARAIVKSVRGSALDLTLTAVIGKTLLSNLSIAPKSATLLRIERHGVSDDPRQFGADAALEVLAEMPLESTRSSP
jgi:hydroxymethylbilane synthase